MGCGMSRGRVSRNNARVAPQPIAQAAQQQPQGQQQHSTDSSIRSTGSTIVEGRIYYTGAEQSRANISVDVVAEGSPNSPRSVSRSSSFESSQHTNSNVSVGSVGSAGEGQYQFHGGRPQSASSSTSSTGSGAVTSDRRLYNTGTERSVLNIPANVVAVGSPSNSGPHSQSSRSGGYASDQGSAQMAARNRLRGTPESSTEASSVQSSIANSASGRSVNSLLSSSLSSAVPVGNVVGTYRARLISGIRKFFTEK